MKGYVSGSVEGVCHLQAEGFLRTASFSKASAARAASSFAISWPNPVLMVEGVGVGGVSDDSVCECECEYV